MPGTPHTDGHPEPGPEAPVADIQADIERTRAALGETAEALAARLDVRRRAREKVAAVRANAVPIAAAAGAIVVVIAIRHRRRRSSL